MERGVGRPPTGGKKREADTGLRYLGCEAPVPGSWTSKGGAAARALQRSKQVNQRHAAQNGRYPILSISATQRPDSPSHLALQCRPM